MGTEKTSEKSSAQDVLELVALGISYEAQNLDDKALETYEKALAADPHSLQALLAIAAFQNKKDDIEKAYEYMARVFDAHPENADAFVARGLLRFAEKARRPELADYEKALAIDPNHREALYNLAAAYLESSKVPAAADKVKRLKILVPQEGLVYYLEGLLRGREGRLKEEIKCYERARELDSDMVAVHYNLGVALQEAGRAAEAIDAFRVAMDLEPESLDIYLNLGSAYFDEGRNDDATTVLAKASEKFPECADVWYNLGYVLAASHQYDAAVEAYQKAVAIDNTMADAYYNMAFIRFKRGDYEKAIAGYQRVIELQPERFKAYYNLAFSFDRCQRYEEAIDIYKRTLTFRPDDHKTYSKLAMVYYHMKDWRKVRNASVRSLEMERVSNAEAHYYLGLVAEHEGKWEEAAEQMKSALRQEANFKDAHIKRAAALRRLGNLEEAKLEAKEAVRQKATASSYYELGRAYGELGEGQKALAAFKKALEFDKEDVKSIIAVADQLMKQNEVDGAIDTCRSSIEAGVNSYQLHYHLALALEAKGDLHESVAEGKRAAKLNKDFAPAYAVIGKAYKALGDEQRANKYLSRYRQLKP